MIGTSKYGHCDCRGHGIDPRGGTFSDLYSTDYARRTPNPEIAMPAQLKGRKVAFLATDGVEQLELTAPWNALKQAGADVTLLSDKTGEIQAVNRDEKGDRFPVDAAVSGASARDFDALVLPGGVANPAKLC